MANLNIGELVTELTQYASEDINRQLGLSPWYDQTRGNRCDLLTRYVLEGLRCRGVNTVRRELHQDPDTLDWHFMLAHSPLGEKPSSSDTVSDLNPWRGGGDRGSGILHGARETVMHIMGQNKVPKSLVELRSIQTITEAHHEGDNPYR